MAETGKAGIDELAKAEDALPPMVRYVDKSECLSVEDQVKVLEAFRQLVDEACAARMITGADQTAMMISPSNVCRNAGVSYARYLNTVRIRDKRFDDGLNDFARAVQDELARVRDDVHGVATGMALMGNERMIALVLGTGRDDTARVAPAPAPITVNIQNNVQQGDVPLPTTGNKRRDEENHNRLFSAAHDYNRQILNAEAIEPAKEPRHE